MNWYKKILAQSYQDIMDDPDTYSDPDDPEHYDANRYFSIGQNEDSDEEVGLNLNHIIRIGCCQLV